MCEYFNEPDGRFAFLNEVIDQKDRRIEELEEEVDELKDQLYDLKMVVADLEEYKWRYDDLCR